MAGPITLLQYLQWTPPALPLDDITPSTKKHHEDQVGPTDITRVERWTDFNLTTIMTEFRPLLQETTIESEPMPSPPRSIRDVEQVRKRFYQFLDDRIRRALRAGFAHLVEQNQMENRAEISIDGGTAAAVYGNSKSDISFFEPSLPTESRPNRAPGDIKPSWKWTSAVQWRSDPQHATEFKKVLSQVNYYMKQQQTRYGLVVTDRELVAIRRVNNDGHLLLSDPVPWSTQGNAEEPQLTILLALWYVGMLASDNTGWRLV